MIVVSVISSRIMLVYLFTRNPIQIILLKF